jgi:hypothetical protein
MTGEPGIADKKISCNPLSISVYQPALLTARTPAAALLKIRVDTGTYLLLFCKRSILLALKSRTQLLPSA